MIENRKRFAMIIVLISLSVIGSLLKLPTSCYPGTLEMEHY